MSDNTALYYNSSYTQYSIPSNIVVDRLCNSYTVINIGTTVMTVNGIPLNPGVPGTNNGESFSLGGNKGEIFTGRIDIGFATGVGLCVVIQKFYTPEIKRNDSL
jgi:hypothetical protein